MALPLPRLPAPGTLLATFAPCGRIVRGRVPGAGGTAAADAP